MYVDSKKTGDEQERRSLVRHRRSYVAEGGAYGVGEKKMNESAMMMMNGGGVKGVEVEVVVGGSGRREKVQVRRGAAAVVPVVVVDDDVVEQPSLYLYALQSPSMMRRGVMKNEKWRHRVR